MTSYHLSYRAANTSRSRVAIQALNYCITKRLNASLLTEELFLASRFVPSSGPTASADNKTVLEDVVATIDAAGRKNGASQTPTPTLQAVAPAAGAHQAFVPRPTVARTTNPSAPGSLSPVLPTDTGAHYSSTIRGAAEITEFDGCGLSPAWKAAPADAAGAPASFASLSSNGNTTINSLSGEGTAPAPALVGCSTSLLAAAAEANRFVSSAGKAAGVTVGAERWLANQGRGMVAGPDSPGAAHVQVGEKEVLGEAECRDAAGAAASPREILMGHKGYRDSGDDATGKNQPTAPVSMAEVRSRCKSGGRRFFFQICLKPWQESRRVP